jgi:hypothetical protein
VPFLLFDGWRAELEGRQASPFTAREAAIAQHRAWAREAKGQRIPV